MHYLLWKNKPPDLNQSLESGEWFWQFLLADFSSTEIPTIAFWFLILLLKKSQWLEVIISLAWFRKAGFWCTVPVALGVKNTEPPNIFQQNILPSQSWTWVAGGKRVSRAYHIWLSHDHCCSPIQSAVINAIPKMEAELPVSCQCVDTISWDTRRFRWKWNFMLSYREWTCWFRWRNAAVTVITVGVMVLCQPCKAKMKNVVSSRQLWLSSFGPLDLSGVTHTHLRLQ